MFQTEKAISAENESLPLAIAIGSYVYFTVSFIYLIYEITKLDMEMTMGSAALYLVTISLFWDNFIVALGSIFFRDAHMNQNKFQVLTILSYPRFILHAVAVPLQCITISEMGKTAGVALLKIEFVQMMVILGSLFLIVSTEILPEIILKTHHVDNVLQKPASLLEKCKRKIVKFSHKNPSLLHIIPSIIVIFFNIFVGILSLLKDDDRELSMWLISAGTCGLLGNALPQPLVTFTGNASEAAMQFFMIKAAHHVYTIK